MLNNEGGFNYNYNKVVLQTENFVYKKAIYIALLVHRQEYRNELLTMY
jgi:hypothetical protein